MNTLNFKDSIFIIFCLLFITVSSFAQGGNVNINQDDRIITLLELKKEINKSDNAIDRYKIQVYNGNRAGATSAQKNFASNYSDWHSKIIFDTPNFKLWAGSFRTRLEADRALTKIKRNFPNAFVFKPKKRKP